MPYYTALLASPHSTPDTHSDTQRNTEPLQKNHKLFTATSRLQGSFKYKTLTCFLFKRSVVKSKYIYLSIVFRFIVEVVYLSILILADFILLLHHILKDNNVLVED